MGFTITIFILAVVLLLLEYKDKWEYSKELKFVAGIILLVISTYGTFNDKIKEGFRPAWSTIDSINTSLDSIELKLKFDSTFQAIKKLDSTAGVIRDNQQKSLSYQATVRAYEMKGKSKQLQAALKSVMDINMDYDRHARLLAGNDEIKLHETAMAVLTSIEKEVRGCLENPVVTYYPDLKNYLIVYIDSISAIKKEVTGISGTITDHLPYIGRISSIGFKLYTFLTDGTSRRDAKTPLDRIREDEGRIFNK